MDISFLFSFAFSFSSFLSYFKTFSNNHFAFLHSFSWGWSWSLPPVQCHEPLFIVLQALCLIPWIYLSLPLYNHKGFDLGHTWMVLGLQRVGHDWATELNWTEWCGGFPYFLPFKSEIGNKEFMIWAIVSSQSCFCWLYRASPSLAANNINNLILELTIWWCPCVESSLVSLEEGVCYDQCILLAKPC